MEFPKRIYTSEEVEKARELVEKGYKHNVSIKGSPSFKQKVKKALELVTTADYLDFLRTYIRSIEEIDGLTQLRQADATIWANKYGVENPVDAASVFIQKAFHMKEYLEGKLYYGGVAEKRSIKKRREFLETLRTRTKDNKIIAECDRLLKMWAESSMIY
ncbi:MAG TPA: hypothetical protein VMT01_04170 [Candidatus Acidoferrum sp.]|jgi:hypothetical protein|nr:hypothetical protein [Candidatus Acidoferrum sp.]